MPFPFDEYPWAKFEDLNIAYMIHRLGLIISAANAKLEELDEWKTATEQDLENWKNSTMDLIAQWEREFMADVNEWEHDTEQDLAQWKIDTIAALDVWKAGFITQYEALRVETEHIRDVANAAAQEATQAAVSASADAASISASAAQIQSNSDDVAALKIACLHTREDITFTKGTINATGTFAPANNGAYTQDLQRGIDAIHADAAVVFTLYLYDINGSYIGKINSAGELDMASGNWKYFTGQVDIESILNRFNAPFFRICIQPMDGTVITDDNANTYSNSHTVFYESRISTKMDKIPVEYPIDKAHLVSGSLQTATMDIAPNNACVTYPAKIPANGNERICIDPPQIEGVATYKYRFGFYDANGAYLSQIALQESNETSLPSNARYFSFHACGFDSGGAQVSFNVLQAFSNSDVIKIIYPNRFVPTSDFALKEWVDANYVGKNSGGYSVSAPYTRFPVASTLKGSLAFEQSFCIYNDKYYSTDGTHIAEQDSNFNLIRQANISIGHGNSLQLGTGGKAYASGWDDNKIYVVNLSTLAVESAITLPTTGYTTAAIDDKNKIAYIFQRDTYPNTLTDYKFIIYNYDSEQIISQRVVKTFGAMQACDYLNGRIAVSYGLGNQTIPNGLDIYNTTGDIIGSFNMGIFDLSEIEGVSFDRANGHGVYVSFHNCQVYLLA